MASSRNRASRGGPSQADEHDRKGEHTDQDIYKRQPLVQVEVDSEDQRLHQRDFEVELAVEYLRIAESVTVSGARLATGRAGSPLAGRVSHPLDDKQGFMKSSPTPILLDQPCLVALDINL